MMSLEKWKYSYNFKQYEKIEQHLNAIVIEQQKAESIPQKLLREYYEKKNTIRQKKYTVIAHLQDLGKKHKEEIKRAKALYEEKVFELKENHRFELNEIKMQVRLHLLKIKVNYEKVLKNYDHAINSGDAKAISKKEQFINDYKAYFANETLVHKNKLNDKKFELKQKLDADLKLVKGEFLNTKEKLKSQYTDKTYSYVPLSKTNLTYKAYKKYEYREQIKVHNQELKLVKEAYLQVKQERAKEVEDIRKSASEAKSLHYAKIKEIKLENKAHYKSLSKADKAIYKANQKFVNQHEKVRYLKAFDKYEKKVFSKINPAYIYVLPASIGALFFTVLPFIFMIIASLFIVNLNRLERSRFVGFNNFINIINLDTEFQKAFGNTLWYAFVTVILLTIVVVAMSAWLARNTKIHNLAQTMIFTPHIASLVAISILWIAMLNPTGIINQGLALFGIQGPGWLIQENTSLISVSFVTIWKDIGYYVLIIISGLQAIPAYIYEAAKLDKSSKTKTFFKMTLPLLMPTLSFVFVTKFIASFKVFAPIEIMTNGGPMGSSMVLSYWIYKVGRIGYNYGNAMSGAIILTLLIGGFTFLNYRYFRKQVTY